MGAMERKRIGVIIRSFEAKALVALKYLVLAQNLQQESFEFEILPAADAFLDRLDSTVPQKRQELGWRGDSRQKSARKKHGESDTKRA
jgi:hypothetical protein